MSTLLVTGGAGFIGSNFIIHFLRQYPSTKVINLDKLTYAGNLQNLKDIGADPGYEFIHGDICDKELVRTIFERHTIDYVLNFAAESHVDNSILDPEPFVRTNVLGTAILLNAARKSWEDKAGFKTGKRYLQVSTDEVYGSLGDTGFFTEKTPLAPNSPYSASKAAADMITLAYFHTYGMPVNITRCGNNYGPRQFPEKLIPLMITNALGKKPLPVYGDGLNIRDWLYVEDHCRAIDLVLHQGRPGEVYNVGGGNERTNIQIVRAILAYLKQHVDDGINETLIHYVEDRKGHDRRYGIDAAKIQKELGWTPLASFDKGMETTLQWYMDNRQWAEAVFNGTHAEI